MFRLTVALLVLICLGGLSPAADDDAYAAAFLKCKSTGESVRTEIPGKSGVWVLFVEDGVVCHKQASSEAPSPVVKTSIPATKKTCVCGDECKCQAGDCPGKCPLAPTINLAPQTVQYRQDCSGGTCRLVPVNQGVSGYPGEGGNWGNTGAVYTQAGVSGGCTSCSGATGATSAGACSTGTGRSGHAPILRIRGGPGVIRSLFRGCH